MHANVWHALCGFVWHLKWAQQALLRTMQSFERSAWVG
eukprot:CAMPEP_0170568738 /NCGR_PEP_ID=MMETSP0224-20130122/127_1 /TAXON_ID=285029 /ORGANISM="Togula jolla, Strain CCCM 725" /LENGTH=37 /DNA_ID= /DNA_START= /DNA_END= /DNA_ORIENTATION=